MAGRIDRKPIAFTLMVTVTVLIGSIVMMAYPMLRADMHPRLETLKPFTPLQLAGRDVYQREGCVNCHTQTVRPLRSEVLRYGDYSKAGEFANDRPFLWGSKRTGPDLAREGGLRNDEWHYRHYANPQAVVPRSNMPPYAFLASEKLDAVQVKAHMDALGAKYEPAQIEALRGKTAMDALVAYTQQLGHAVARKAGKIDLAAVNPLGVTPQAVARGRQVYADKCAVCHGDDGSGGVGPNLRDVVFLNQPGDGSDGAYHAIIAEGSACKEELGRGGDPAGGMPAFKGELGKDDLWSLVSLVRSLQQEAAQQGAQPQGTQPQGGKP